MSKLNSLLCLLLRFLLVSFRMCSLNFIPVSALHVIICSGDLCMHSKHTLCWVTRATSITSEWELVATSNLNANRTCIACNGLSFWSGSKHNLHRQNSRGSLLLPGLCVEVVPLFFFMHFFLSLVVLIPKSLIQGSLIAIVFLQLNDKLKNKHLLGYLTVKDRKREGWVVFLLPLDLRLCSQKFHIKKQNRDSCVMFRSK